MGIVRFHLFGFPVSILPGYWLLTALLAFSWASQSPGLAALIMVCVFLSILVHELGHAFAARAFGMPAQITFHMLGGATSFPTGARLSRGRDIMISLAGPAAGLVLGVVALILLQLYAPSQWFEAASSDVEGTKDNSLFLNALQVLWFLNIFYSLLNLVPVIPFDGGRVLMAALGPRRTQVAATISLVVGLATAFIFFRMKWLLPALLFGTAGVTSYLRMRNAGNADPTPADTEEDSLEQVLSAARKALDSGAHDQAGKIAHQVLSRTRSRETGRKALEIALWARLGADDATSARALLDASPPGAVDPYLAGAVLEASGAPEAAEKELTEARQRGDERVELAALLVKVMLQRGEFGRAAALTADIVAQSPPEEVRRVAQEADEGGAQVEAARLLLALAKSEKSFNDAKSALYGFVAAGLAQDAVEAFRLMVGFDKAKSREVLGDAALAGVRSELEAAV